MAAVSAAMQKLNGSRSDREERLKGLNITQITADIDAGADGMQPPWRV